MLQRLQTFFQPRRDHILLMRSRLGVSMGRALVKDNVDTPGITQEIHGDCSHCCDMVISYPSHAFLIATDSLLLACMRSFHMARHTARWINQT